MRAFVTGAAGFLGCHVVRQLVERGLSVRALVQAESHAQDWRTAGVEPVVGDLLCPQQLHEQMRGVDVVYHCAAKLPGKASAEEIWRVNVTGTENVLAGCLANGGQRMVYVSTDSVYGDGDCPAATEETPLNPDYPLEGNYPRAKLEGERLAMRSYRDQGLPVSIVRPCLMYGPGQSPGNDILRRWAAKPVHLLFDGGQARLSLGYVADVAEAVVLAGTVPHAVGQCYNVCDGVAYSKRDIFITLSKIFGRRQWLLSLPSGPVLWGCDRLHPLLKRVHPRLASRFDPLGIRFGLVNHVIDCRKAREELGYSPKVLLREGLERTFAWLAEPQPLL